MSETFNPTQLFSLIIENTDEMINVHDGEGCYLYVSPAMIRLTGYSREELIGCQGFDLCHPDDRAPTRERISEMFRSRKACRVQYRRLHKDGTYHWIESHLVQIPTEAGNAACFLSVARDISAQMETQETLRRREAQYRNLLDALPDIVCRFNREGRMLYLTSSIERETGLTAADLVGRNISEVSRTEEQRLRWTEGIERVFRTGAVQEFEFIFPTPRGERTFHTRLVPETSGEDVENVLSITQDVTESRLALTQQLMMEKRLQEGQRMESLGVLAGGIAHDFNNLLMSIMGYTELSLNTLPADHEVREHLEQVQIASKRAADLTRQMLAFAGKRKYTPKPVNLNSMVTEISKLLAISIARNAILHIDLDESLPMLEGEATQLRQVVMNLVINASEALGGKPGTISLQTGTEFMDTDRLKKMQIGSTLPPGRCLFLRVTDTGEGMTEATLARIFEPFYTTKFTGRGLGLAAASGILQEHRGALQVTTAPGKGTEFLLVFPISEEEEEHEVEPEAVSLPRGKRLLLVDDDATVRNVASRMLKAKGFEVVQAGGVNEALEQLETAGSTFDLLVVDYLMPEGGGSRVAERTRQIAPRLPILVMSGYSGDEVLPESEAWQDVAFLQKPFTMASLFLAVSEAQALRDPSAK